MYKCSICGKGTTNDQTIHLSSGLSIEAHRCDKCDKQWHREMDWECDNEHCFESQIICPYCDYEFGEYESSEFADCDEAEVMCPECEKTFLLNVQQTIEYSTHKRTEDMPEDWENEE